MARPAAPLLQLTPGALRLDALRAVHEGGVRVELDPACRPGIVAAAEVVAQAARGERPVYGVNTGFGKLATERIGPGELGALQLGLIRSHAAGVGEPLRPPVVRLVLALKAASLARGASGVRPEVVDALLGVLDRGLVPFIPGQGSVGASGDLAPLAHLAAALLGEGAFLAEDGSVREAAPVLAAHGLEPLVLAPKEGLALINGTDGILGMLVLALHDLDRLLKTADVTAAMTVEALLGTDRAFAADLQALRPHAGQVASAANLRRLLADSEIVASHRYGDSRVQDAYSLRCTPQVHGAARDTAVHAAGVAAVELRSAIDNPMILPDGRVESCGNFHGAPVGFACDFLAIAAAEVGAIAERRTDRLLDATRSHGLPPFLTTDAGVNSGMMIAHYTQAAMVAENRRLAAPASVDSLPTSAMQEDHVSMGWGAARKLRLAVANLTRILAVELSCAARGLDLRAPLAPAPATAAALAALRGAGVEGPGPDRFLAPELAAAEELIASGALLAATDAAIGPLE